MPTGLRINQRNLGYKGERSFAPPKQLGHCTYYAKAWYLRSTHPRQFWDSLLITVGRNFPSETWYYSRGKFHFAFNTADSPLDSPTVKIPEGCSPLSPLELDPTNVYEYSPFKGHPIPDGKSARKSQIRGYS